MAITYSEFSVSGSATIRVTSATFGTKIYAPGNSDCLVIDTTTLTSYTFAIPASTNRFTCQKVGTELWVPRTGTMLVIDTTTDTYTSFAMTGTHEWRTSQIWNGYMVGPYPVSSTSVGVGMVNLSTRAYTAITDTAPSVSRTFHTSALVGDLLWVAGAAAVIGNYDLAANNYTETSRTGGNLMRASANLGSEAVLVTGANAYKVDTTPSANLALSVTGTQWHAGTSAGGLGYFPRSSSSNSLVVIDPTGSMSYTTPAAATSSRDRYCADLVGDKLFMVHNNHASCGIFHDIPLPIVRRRRRGLGMILR